MSSDLPTFKLCLQDKDLDVDMSTLQIFGKFSLLMQRAYGGSFVEGKIFDVLNLPFYSLPIMNSTVETIMKWVYYHNDHPLPTPDPSKEDGTGQVNGISEWDQGFMAGLGTDRLFDLLQAARFLEMDELYDVCIKTINSMMEGKSVREMRQEFKISRDMNKKTEETVQEIIVL